MKKLWVAVLAGIMLAGLVCASAFADVLENIVVSDITYHSSGCLAGFTMSYDVLEWNLESAPARVSVQTVKFSDQRSGSHTFGDLRDNGRYAYNHPTYTTWPDKPDDCGFVTWNSEGTFPRPGTGGRGQLDITFEDGKVDCKAGQTYYLYVWANYNGHYGLRTYPDAFVMEFKTGTGGNGGITVGGGATVVPGNQGNQGNQNQGNPEPVNQNPANMPRTGDHSALALWVTLALLACCGMLVLVRRGENNG